RESGVSRESGVESQVGSPESTPNSRFLAADSRLDPPDCRLLTDSRLSTPDYRLARACERAVLPPRHLALRAVIAGAEKCRCVRTLPPPAAVLQDSRLPT